MQPCLNGECVPYYQCANGSIITDGEGLLDIRLGQEDNTNNEKHPCQGLFETCCLLKGKTQIPPETKTNDGCGFRNAEGVGFRITGAQDSEAQFGLYSISLADGNESNKKKLIFFLLQGNSHGRWPF